MPFCCCGDPLEAGVVVESIVDVGVSSACGDYLSKTTRVVLDKGDPGSLSYMEGAETVCPPVPDHLWNLKLHNVRTVSYLDMHVRVAEFAGLFSKTLTRSLLSSSKWGV